jgi:hypothetical protein
VQKCVNINVVYSRYNVILQLNINIRSIKAINDINQLNPAAYLKVISHACTINSVLVNICPAVRESYK